MKVLLSVVQLEPVVPPDELEEELAEEEELDEDELEPVVEFVVPPIEPPVVPPELPPVEEACPVVEPVVLLPVVLPAEKPVVPTPVLPEEPVVPPVLPPQPTSEGRATETMVRAPPRSRSRRFNSARSRRRVRVFSDMAKPHQGWTPKDDDLGHRSQPMNGSSVLPAWEPLANDGERVLRNLVGRAFAQLVPLETSAIPKNAEAQAKKIAGAAPKALTSA
jgi:hypothetical protein